MKSYILILSLLVSINAHAVIIGYIMGSDYVKMSTEEQSGWVVGVMDGIMAESISSKSEPSHTWLGGCLKRHDILQLKAIFEKELTENPEGWHAPAAFVYRSTIYKFCNAK